MDSLDSISSDSGSSAAFLGSDPGSSTDVTSPDAQASWGQAMADLGAGGDGGADGVSWDDTRSPWDSGVTAAAFTPSEDSASSSTAEQPAQDSADGTQARVVSDDAWAVQPNNANPYARQAGESTDNWVTRLGDASNALNGLQDTDLERANAGRLQRNAAIAADTEFQSSQFADAQCLTLEAFRNPAQYGGIPVADQSVGYGGSPDQSIEERLQHFSATNMSPTLRMGADGVIYDFGKSLSQASQAQSALSAIHGYNDQAANNLGEQISKNGLAAVPPETWATSLLGMAGTAGSGPAQGPATLSPARRLHILDGDKTVAVIGLALASEARASFPRAGRTTRSSRKSVASPMIHHLPALFSRTDGPAWKEHETGLLSALSSIRTAPSGRHTHSIRPAILESGNYGRS